MKLNVRDRLILSTRVLPAQEAGSLDEAIVAERIRSRVDLDENEREAINFRPVPSLDDLAEDAEGDLRARAQAIINADDEDFETAVREMAELVNRAGRGVEWDEDEAEPVELDLSEDEQAFLEKCYDLLDAKEQVPVNDPDFLDLYRRIQSMNGAADQE